MNRELWPPCLPGLNPCKFYVWGMLKDKVCINNPGMEDGLGEKKKAFRTEGRQFNQNFDMQRTCMLGFMSLSVSCRKPFPAPPLNIVSKNLILTVKNI